MSIFSTLATTLFERVLFSLTRPVMKWSAIAASEPALDAVAFDRLIRPGVLLVGTVRRDGSPRISGAEPLVMDGDLWLSMMSASAKAKDLAREKGYEQEYKLYDMVERLTPSVFKRVKNSDKVISANVDFYSGFVYHMLDIPMDLFTPIFAAARIPGWTAHRIEESINGGRILRPAYKHIRGEAMTYIPIGDRK